MTDLLVGFDSAWTPSNSGALVGVLRRGDGTFAEIGSPLVAGFLQAESTILAWEETYAPTRTLIMLDQPMIVPNANGQRPVENLVASVVGVRRGAVQPASTSRGDMFGLAAPVWAFLAVFGGPSDPRGVLAGRSVVESYPVLAMITLGWGLTDVRTRGRLPKYNPARKTFAIEDWRHVCRCVSDAFGAREIKGLAGWTDRAATLQPPRKCDQDRLDACLCLVVAIHFAEGRDCLMVGDIKTGYMVVPHNEDVRLELAERCRATGRKPGEWLGVFSRV